MGRLGRAAVADYLDDGYCVVRDQVFDEARFAALAAIFEEHLEDRGDRLSDELDTPHWRDPRLLEFLLADEVLDLVEPIVGPDIVLFSSHFIAKDARTGRATPWHEDAHLWRPLRLSDDTRIVTVWLALDRSTAENGCLRVVPGSHREGEHAGYVDTDPARHTFRTGIRAVDESTAVDIELERGQASLHDGRIVHGASPNRSGARRAGYTMRYFPATVRMAPEVNETFKLWLARGRNLAGNRLQNGGTR